MDKTQLGKGDGMKGLVMDMINPSPEGEGGKRMYVAS